MTVLRPEILLSQEDFVRGVRYMEHGAVNAPVAMPKLDTSAEKERMMALLPYGGGYCDVTDDPTDNPWKTLKTIQQNLERCEELRPDHARWLGDAIERCNDDPNVFLLLLGIKKQKGKPSPFPPDSWLEYGQQIDALEDGGETPEHAINIVLNELAKVYLSPPDPPDRHTLQRWREKYRKARRDWEESGYP